MIKNLVVEGTFTDLEKGKMSMSISPFVEIDYDTAQRKAYVSVEDREVKKQREMWGKRYSSTYIGIILTIARNNSGIP